MVLDFKLVEANGTNLVGVRFDDVGIEQIVRATREAIHKGRGDYYTIGELLGMTKEGAMNRIKRLELMGEVLLARFEAERSDPEYREMKKNLDRPLWHMGEEGLE